MPVIYFFWPETARLSLEEIGKQFGDEVAVHVNDATDEERAALDRKLAHGEQGEVPAEGTSPTSDSPKDADQRGTSGEGESKE